MAGYGTSLGLAAVGLATFLMNYDSNFNQKLFWKAKLGKQHARECFNDEKIREKGIATKDDEIWLWVGGNHPTYLPFDTATAWICDTLVGKYEDKSVTRPEWMNAENDEVFIKRIAEICMWKESYEDEVKKALHKLFESGADLEVGVDEQVTIIKTKKSGKFKVKPEP